MRIHRFLAHAAVAACALAGTSRAGVMNPDISVIGQPFVFLTTAPDDANRERLQLDVGEVEFFIDAYLNPYARGTFVPVIGDEGAELEEGYFSLVRYLPLGLGLKGGKYRVDFGRQNIAHPHTYPFAERFGVLAAFLPGEESFNEIGVSLSERLALHGDTSLELAVDWLQGDSFRIERESSGDSSDPLEQGDDDRAGESRPAFNGRIAAFAMLGDQSGLECGLSLAGGTNNVAAGTRTLVYGADAKAKLWTSPRAYLLLQGELLRLEREDAGWDPAAAYTQSRTQALGGYVYADYNWATRYNVGVSYEAYEQPAPATPLEQSVGAFAGLALMEETTSFRADWRRHIPEGADAFDEFTLRVIFSMGPHKAHQF
jgi:hypothetical protein